MLDQLVESKSNAAANTRRSGFLLTTFVIMVSVMVGGWMYSLFAKDYNGLGSGDLELSSLVAPVPVAEDDPPPPKIEPKNEVKAAPNVDTRTEIIQRMDESPKTPDKISTVQNTVKPPREGIATRVGASNNDFKDSASDDYKGRGNTEGTGLAGSKSDSPTGGKTGGDTPPPPPPPPPPAAPKPVVPKKISGGVLNGKATSLPKPPYPAAARAVRASGAVNVQVTISETGSVVSASAVTGHPLLRQAAEQAARQARFAPTMLSGQPVSVTGVIVYNFVP